MNILSLLNSAPMYAICGGIIAFVAVVCAVFMVRAYRAGLAMGIDRTKLRRAITSSATFSLLPSVGILLGVIALSGRLAAEMTPSGFATIALLMSVCIMWGMILSIFFNKRYLNRLGSGKKSSGSAGFGDTAMTAMFIGLVSAYIGSYIGGFISGGGLFSFSGSFMPLIVVFVSGLVMAGFIYLAEKKKLAWVESFSIAGSMLIGMAAAVVVKLFV